MHLRSAFRTTAAGEVRPVIDLKSLCEEIGDLCADLKVLEAPDALPADVDLLENLRKAAEDLKAFVTPQREQIERFVNTLSRNTPAWPRTAKARAKNTKAGEDSGPFVVFHKRHSIWTALTGWAFSPHSSLRKTTSADWDS